jgi:hypothetical protein
MIFAVTGEHYKSKLLFLDGDINAAKDIQNIEDLGFIDELDQIHGEFNWILQQDRATCYTAAEVVDWLEESLDLIPDWPANSPDLNPIELLWAILKAAVRKFHPKTLDELRVVLQAAWNSISQEMIDRLVGSFPTRLIQCETVGEQCISNDLWRMGSLREMLGDHDTRRTREWKPSEDEKLPLCMARNGSRSGNIFQNGQNACFGIDGGNYRK